MKKENPTNEMALVIQKEGLKIENCDQLLSSFAPLFQRAKQIGMQALDINVEDPSQTDEINRARIVRLELKKVRVEADKLRKNLKEDSLRTGRAIQGVYNLIEFATKPVEERLEEMEKLGERMEKERLDNLQKEREDALRPYVEDVRFYTVRELDDATFQTMLESIKKGHALKVAEDKRIAEEKAAKERAEQEERQHVADENRRLKEEAEKARAEKEAAEAKARQEREAIEAKAAAERQEAEEKASEERRKREAAERELEKQEKARQEAEKAEREAAERAAKAPDAEKIVGLAEDVAEMGRELPDMKTEAGRAAMKEIQGQFAKFSKWLIGVSQKLKQ